MIVSPLSRVVPPHESWLASCCTLKPINVCNQTCQSASDLNWHTGRTKTSARFVLKAWESKLPSITFLLSDHSRWVQTSNSFHHHGSRLALFFRCTNWDVWHCSQHENEKSRLGYFMGFTAWRSPRNQHHLFKRQIPDQCLNPNWQIHIKFTTDFKKYGNDSWKQVVLSASKKSLDFQELLDGVQKTSRGPSTSTPHGFRKENPHRLTTSKVPRMQVLHQRRIMVGYKIAYKNHHLSALMVFATFCYILSHRFTK